MAAQGGLVTYGSSVTAGMETVREDHIGLFDQPICHTTHVFIPPHGI